MYQPRHSIFFKVVTKIANDSNSSFDWILSTFLTNCDKKLLDKATSYYQFMTMWDEWCSCHFNYHSYEAV